MKISILFMTALVGSSHYLIADDSVQQMLEAYSLAVAELRSDNPSAEDRIQFREEWREQILVVTQANPESPYYKLALVKILGLSNGLNDTKMADAVAAELEQLEQDPSEKMRWLGEKGELARQLFLQTGDEEHRSKAIAALRSAVTQVSSFEDLPSDFHRQWYITYRIMLAEMLPPDESIQELKAVTSNLEAVPTLAADLQNMGSGIERVTRQLIMSLVDKNDREAVNDALRTLESASIHDSLHQELWYTIFETAERLYPDDDGERLGFLQEWLREEPDGKLRSPMLLYHVAKLELLRSEHQQALRSFTELKDDHKKYFLEHDVEFVTSGAGGYYAEILFGLAECYAHVGQPKEARDNLNEAEVIVPNDVRHSMSVFEPGTIGPSVKVSSSRFRGMFILLNIILLIGVAVLAMRRKRKVV